MRWFRVRPNHSKLEGEAGDDAWWWCLVMMVIKMYSEKDAVQWWCNVMMMMIKIYSGVKDVQWWCHVMELMMFQCLGSLSGTGPEARMWVPWGDGWQHTYSWRRPIIVSKHTSIQQSAYPIYNIRWSFKDDSLIFYLCVHFTKWHITFMEWNMNLGNSNS